MANGIVPKASVDQQWTPSVLCASSTDFASGETDH
jgi:hypothetical protein